MSNGKEKERTRTVKYVDGKRVVTKTKTKTTDGKSVTKEKIRKGGKTVLKQVYKRTEKDTKGGKVVRTREIHKSPGVDTTKSRSIKKKGRKKYIDKTAGEKRIVSKSGYGRRTSFPLHETEGLD